MSYLAQLTLRLAAGALSLPEDFRQRQARYLASQQAADGGFPGRQGPGDLYYTGFALRGLALVGALEEPVAARAAAFLQARLDDPLPAVDFLSLVFSAVLLEAVAGIDVFGRAGADRKERVARALEPLRRDDGSYAKTSRGVHGSTYHTFLAAACKQLAGLPLDEAPEMLRWIASQRRADGGFVELAPLEHSGTNPTAAAIGLFRLLSTPEGPMSPGLDEATRAGAVRFLAGMQNFEGGLRANTRIPAADLLSTFAGLVALADLDALAQLDRDAARRYVQALELPEGGFRGGAWDDRADVEYTFYGLASLALLAHPGP
jgi:geranylgeranyl transferase type-2 subunit beta